MIGPHPSPANFGPGQSVWIAHVPPATRDQLKPEQAWTVEHCTRKALLVQRHGEQRWIPLKALTPSSNTRNVYALARWFRFDR